MKRLSILAAFVAATATAQPPPTTKGSDVSEPNTAQAEMRASGVTQSPAAARTNTVSGVFVQAARVRNPAQLINPRAPMRYGNGYDNVSIDPISGRAQGIKLFVINF